MVKSVKERRQWIRAKRILSIQFRLSKAGRRMAGSTWHLSTTKEMSAGGLSFYTGQEYRINNILEIHVAMSGVLDIYKGYAKVVRVDRKRTGSYSLVAVKFVEKAKKRSRNAKTYKQRSSTRTKVKAKKRI